MRRVSILVKQYLYRNPLHYLYEVSCGVFSREKRKCGTCACHYPFDFTMELLSRIGIHLYLHFHSRLDLLKLCLLVVCNYMHAIKRNKGIIS